MLQNKQELIELIANKVQQQQEKYYPDKPKNLAHAPALLHALIEEAIEAIRFLPARKGWAKDNEPIISDRQAYIEELADIQIFLLAILHHSDISITEFVETVYYKQIKNERRTDHKQSKID